MLDISWLRKSGLARFKLGWIAISSEILKRLAKQSLKDMQRKSVPYVVISLVYPVELVDVDDDD